MRRYVLTRNHGVIDTDVSKHPHEECFVIKDNILYEEYTSGDLYPYSEVLATFSTIDEVLRACTVDSGKYECFHCGSRSVIWQADFSFEDMGYDGDGIVHICTCSNCGAEIEYRIPIEKEGE